MATARKLPSGNYRVRIYDSCLEKYKSFTAPTKKEAERMAAEYKIGSVTNKQFDNISVKQAVRNYIDSKDGVLSPSSVRGYDIIYKNSLDGLDGYTLRTITEVALQQWVSGNSKGINCKKPYAPKSVKSQFALVRCALEQNKVRLDYASIQLPAPVKYIPVVPDRQQIAQILHIVEGTSVEIPVTIAVTQGLRQSEIAGLKWSDYDGEYLHVHASKVPNKENRYEYKDTVKSQASNRVIVVDELLKNRLDKAKEKAKSEFISPMLPSSVLRKFQHLCDDNGLPHFTMHGQRHGNASMMLASGIPDKYAMKRLGQSSNNMIKDIYQHIFSDDEKQIADKMSNTFSDIYATKYDTDFSE